MFHPTTFGKYFLTRRIAVGGMAEVFAAKLYGSDGFEKDLVIKQILPQYARDPEFVQSFVAEAKIAVSLTHANVVSIYELGRVDGTYFIAMEFVDGLDVFALLDAARRQDDPLDPGLALLIVEEVARGLDYAHRKLGPDGLPLGLVHRDLNPRNVLVSREGDVKILDFGIAKTASKTAAMPKTRAGVVKGTTGYMSPEQATGNDIDLRTDLYQAGLLLHECLTGRALFWRPEDHLTRELMRRHEVVPPSRLIRSLPPEIDELVLTCLRIRAEERFQSAAELASAVARVRAIRYPDARHIELGAWVTRLIDRDRVAARAVEDEIPATADFGEVISQAIEQSITGRVETIATRAPSGVFAAPAPRRPTTGSQPIDPRSITGDLVPQGRGTPGPTAPAAVFGSPPLTGGSEHAELAADLEDDARAEAAPFADGRVAALEPLVDHPTSSLTDVEGVTGLQRHRRWAWAGIATVIAASVAAAAVTVRGDPPEPAIAAEPVLAPEAPPEDAELERAAGPRSDAPSAEAAPGSSDDPGEPARAPQTPGLADFGARPCSGRVSIDGRLLPRVTPIFEHALAPGKHRVVMVAEGCPAENAAGALEPRKPRVSTVLMVEPGAKMKVVADFDRRSIIVRRSAP